MSENSRVAIMGDENLLAPLRAFGFIIFSPHSVEEAREMLSQVVNEGYALCLIQERWLDFLKNEMAELSQKFSPVCLGFSDYRQISEVMEKMLSGLSIRATGSDVLFTRGRNDHETR
ncbi:MAG: hypothetical protein JHC32_06930 [Candidatus Aminicenantes bacterium]|jgi:hypothetical protein|nr:hypothetical protein [Candidatus Aminicenantes bacterium]